MTGIILSGGRSTRMGGYNKAFLDFQGERLIDRTVRLFKSIFEEVILVTHSPLEYIDQDVMIVKDIVPPKGPLGGIYTGLFFSSSSRSFVAACDMPFLNEAFIRFMMDKAREHDVVVPETSDGPQPLHAVYSRKCMGEIFKLIEKEKYKITLLYKRVKILKIPRDVILPYDPELRIFSNINAPEDLRKFSPE